MPITIETTYLIRPVEDKDFDACLELIKAFHKEALDEFGIQCEDEAARFAISEYYKTALVLEVDGEAVGVIAGKIIEYPVNKAKIFEEMIWYVKKEHRKYGLKLLETLENRCRDEGITAIIVALMSNLKSEKLGRFYERLGYRSLEHHYLKRLA